MAAAVVRPPRSSQLGVPSPRSRPFRPFCSQADSAPANFLLLRGRLAAADYVIGSMKNEPRYVPPGGAIIEVSNRTQQGRFLLRPSLEVNDLILGVLGRAQRLYSVTIFAYVFLSDHYHILLWVRDALQLASFMNYLDANIALELGKLHDWEGKFWKGPYFSAVVKDTAVSQVSRLHYILSNGCKEGLVGSPIDWPGASAARALVDGSMANLGTWYDRTAQRRALACGRIELFPEPEVVQLSPLPCFSNLSSSAHIEQMTRLISMIETETRRKHRDNHTRPLGKKSVLRQHPHKVPVSMKRARARRFLAAAGESISDLMQAYRDFLTSYREAAKRLRDGEVDVVFPAGCFPPRLPFARAGPAS